MTTIKYLGIPTHFHKMGAENPWGESTDHLAVMHQRVGKEVEEILQKHHKLGKTVFISPFKLHIPSLYRVLLTLQYSIMSLSKIATSNILTALFYVGVTYQ